MDCVRTALERAEARMGDVRRKLSAIPFINSVFAFASAAAAVDASEAS
jgi:hypothetical protein